ncbi:hypothetical protein [Halostella sp. PRR32]|uniref:hypothetical protein n=1 Tax=Halostella sp. PRR32 TaxID=3098147 RepID=UPI002B1E1EC3|nr:hypothetical protein [Halostella sp. PRR32]
MVDRYRWSGIRPHARGDDSDPIEPGEVFEPTEAELAAFDDLMVPVEEDNDDFSTNGWLENDYGDRADAVLEGGLDDYLDEIEEVETSETVIDAVEERREELEEA